VLEALLRKPGCDRRSVRALAREHGHGELATPPPGPYKHRDATRDYGMF
jgi:hypothetical protein